MRTCKIIFVDIFHINFLIFKRSNDTYFETEIWFTHTPQESLEPQLKRNVYKWDVSKLGLRIEFN